MGLWRTAIWIFRHKRMHFVLMAERIHFPAIVTVQTDTKECCRKVHGGCLGNVGRCQWTPWRGWSDCSRECAGGTKRRDRMFCCKSDLADKIELCMEDCGMDYSVHRSGFYDRKDCNTVCSNGGTYMFYGYCRCSDRFKGTCCRDVVTCGQPSKISHGTFHGNDFTYNSQVRYECDMDYNMTDPSKAIRTCTKNEYWSGSSPVCLYAVSCNSNPCMNGGSCTNLLGDYVCNCSTGWTGKNCETDIQPPVVFGCPEDRYITVSEMTIKQNWTEPNITDPLGKEVRISKNYVENVHEFPWGEHVIYYHGVKPSNGLSVECKFIISVKPMPCKELVPPVDGMVLCNGWRKDYSQICVFECKQNYTLPPGFKENDIYVCGATGNWLPGKPFTQCVSEDLFPNTKSGTVSTCTSVSDKQNLAVRYIDRLKASQFNDLCQRHLSDCIPENVNVAC